jgi:hypothetical protein
MSAVARPATLRAFAGVAGKMSSGQRREGKQ